ncbi:hypothetical protein COLO4_22200 [Corchorus olitorius]|uniref:TF-B3 domain-containing protein n=1 Tax=Corchorus olitorius TaxID=93759 RepID=A0A1R3INH5_9ROSI|nr:hypothetical protein COLO4_22200 [Corchorus olitorius]
MASQPRGRENPMFKTKTPHFFKVILDDTIRERKLGIPKLFVRKYGNQLPSPVHLEVPSGQVWKVELTKCDSKVWLQKGWHQFAEHYSLESGHFVVFRYKGNARFDVVIFDRTASEIEYPYIRREVDGTSKCKKRKEKSDMPCTQPQKKMKFNSSNKSGSGINLNPKIVASDAKGKGVESPELEVLKKVTFFTSAEKNEALQKASGFRNELKASAKHNDQGMSGSRRCLKPNLLGRMQQPSTPTKKKRALEPASAFLSTNPSFTVKTQPSYLTCAHVNIPYQFAMSYFKENGEVTLRVSDGRTWIVDYFRKVSREVKRIGIFP